MKNCFIINYLHWLCVCWLERLYICVHLIFFRPASNRMWRASGLVSRTSLPVESEQYVKWMAGTSNAERFITFFDSALRLEIRECHRAKFQRICETSSTSHIAWLAAGESLNANLSNLRFFDSNSSSSFFYGCCCSFCSLIQLQFNLTHFRGNSFFFVGIKRLTFERAKTLSRPYRTACRSLSEGIKMKMSK